MRGRSTYNVPARNTYLPNFMSNAQMHPNTTVRKYKGFTMSEASAAFNAASSTCLSTSAAHPTQRKTPESGILRRKV